MQWCHRQKNIIANREKLTGWKIFLQKYITQIEYKDFYAILGKKNIKPFCTLRNSKYKKMYVRATKVDFE